MSTPASTTPDGSISAGSTVSPSRTRTTAWAFLLVASVFEVTFALATNATNGFTRLWPSLLVVVAAGGGLFFLSTALRTLDVGVGYTVWVGIGSVGTVLLGAVLFDEALSVPKGLCFALIIGGIITLRLTDRPTSEDGSTASREDADAA